MCKPSSVRRNVTIALGLLKKEEEEKEEEKKEKKKKKKKKKKEDECQIVIFFTSLGAYVNLRYIAMLYTHSQCCQVSVFYRNFTDLSWLSSRTTPLGYKRTERGTPSQPCITSPFKQQTISQSCSHHFLLKYDQ